MKYFSLLFALLFMASCHSKQKPSESQREAQDSIQVEQLELPPLESGEVEYKDESMFGEIIELDGRQIIPADSFIFQPREPKMVVKGNRLVMKVFSFGKDAHPYLIFNYPKMTFVETKGTVGPGPEEFRLPDIIPTKDSTLLCYLMETTDEKMYQLDLNGNIIPYSFPMKSSIQQGISLKSDIYNLKRDDFIYIDHSSTGKSIMHSYREQDSICSREIYSLQLNPNMKSPYAYGGFFAVNPEKNRMVYIYQYFSVLKFMDMDATSVKTIKYNLKEFDGRTLRMADGLDKNVTYFWGISGGDDYVYCVYSGRTPVETAREFGEGNTYIYVEQYDWNGNPIRKYKLIDFFGQICVDEKRKIILGLTPFLDDPFVEFKLPE